MAVEITGIRKSGLDMRHRHGPSEDVIYTTAPKDNGGTGEHFSPTDLLATATGACMVTILSLWASEKGMDLGKVEYRTFKHMTSERPRRVARLDIELQFGRCFEAATVAEMRDVALNCPVKLSLSTETEVLLEMSFAG
ncbi:MAG: OsmC family protein [Myxococcota bacterium]|nr:OsmC family protein [Myxococcota bacterium]